MMRGRKREEEDEREEMKDIGKEEGKEGRRRDDEREEDAHMHAFNPQAQSGTCSSVSSLTRAQGPPFISLLRLIP
ncbi:hypothetical protein JOQ06_008471, partial [Pogonophryne albipinna]